MKRVNGAEEEAGCEPGWKQEVGREQEVRIPSQKGVGAGGIILTWYYSLVRNSLLQIQPNLTICTAVYQNLNLYVSILLSCSSGSL